MVPVSYTHLDVYKRQMKRGRPGRSCKEDMYGEMEKEAWKEVTGTAEAFGMLDTKSQLAVALGDGWLDYRKNGLSWKRVVDFQGRSASVTSRQVEESYLLNDGKDEMEWVGVLKVA